MQDGKGERRISELIDGIIKDTYTNRSTRDFRLIQFYGKSVYEVMIELMGIILENDFNITFKNRPDILDINRGFK